MEEQAQIQPATAISSETRLCSICHSASLREVLTLPDIPVLCNVLWDTREAAQGAARGDVTLVFCENCGHVYNQAFDPAKLEYNLQYENSLHFSPRFQRYADWLAHYLVDQYDLRGKSIVEIGSGKGDFLRLLCDLGGNVGTGFDPSYEPAPGEQHPSMSFVRDSYSKKYADYQADFILSRHVLEHIEQPADFVRTLRATIDNSRRTVVFTEVPNLSYILRDTAIWDIIYEHVSYFSGNSLAHLFVRYGFNVLNMGEAYEGQFLYLEAIPRNANRPSPNLPYAHSLEQLSRQVAGFGQRSQEKIEQWSQQMQQLRNAGKRAVLWGAGSKGISFLNLLPVSDQVEYIIDINPRKRNRFVTGTGQQIVPPEFLREYQPDVIIIMNPIYRQEIQDTVRSLGLDAEYLIA